MGSKFYAKKIEPFQPMLQLPPHVQLFAYLSSLNKYIYISNENSGNPRDIVTLDIPDSGSNWSINTRWVTTKNINTDYPLLLSKDEKRYGYVATNGKLVLESPDSEFTHTYYDPLYFNDNIVTFYWTMRDKIDEDKLTYNSPVFDSDLKEVVGTFNGQAIVYISMPDENTLKLYGESRNLLFTLDKTTERPSQDTIGLVEVKSTEGYLLLGPNIYPREGGVTSIGTSQQKFGAVYSKNGNFETITLNGQDLASWMQSNLKNIVCDSITVNGASNLKGALTVAGKAKFNGDTENTQSKTNKIWGAVGN